jgi:hypothetical protein
LQQPEPVAGYGQAAPAAGGAVQHGPNQGQAVAWQNSRRASDLDFYPQRSCSFASSVSS